jgi:hypothetical protein
MNKISDIEYDVVCYDSEGWEAMRVGPMGYELACDIANTDRAENIREGDTVKIEVSKKYTDPNSGAL